MKHKPSIVSEKVYMGYIYDMKSNYSRICSENVLLSVLPYAQVRNIHCKEGTSSNIQGYAASAGIKDS